MSQLPGANRTHEETRRLRLLLHREQNKERTDWAYHRRKRRTTSASNLHRRELNWIQGTFGNWQDIEEVQSLYCWETFQTINCLRINKVRNRSPIQL